MLAYLKFPLMCIGMVLGTYAIVILGALFIEPHITKLIERRANTAKGQQVLREVYYEQRDKAEAERLSSH